MFAFMWMSVYEKLAHLVLASAQSNELYLLAYMNNASTIYILRLLINEAVAGTTVRAYL